MRVLNRIALAMVLISVSLAPPVVAQGGGEVLTNESVIQMVVGKVPRDLIVSKIKSTKSTFDLSPDGLIKLSTGKVPSDMMKLMMNTQAAASGTVKETLTNDGVIKMVVGGLSREIIIAKIQMSKPGYDLTTTGLLDLSKNKVSEEVQKAMLASSSGTPPKPGV
jgi:hypothetical protein